MTDPIGEEGKTVLSDEELKRLKEMIEAPPNPKYEIANISMMSISFNSLKALLARLEAAELKECNQFHCGHPTCNAWRESAGK